MISKLKSHRAAGVIVLVTLVAAIGAGSFLVVRAVASGPQASADSPEYGPTPPVGPQEPFWFVPTAQAAAEKPRYDQVINGIHVGPTSSQRGGPCDGLPGDSPERQTLGYSVARGSRLEIEPRYLPSGTTLFQDQAVVCKGTLSLAGKIFEIPADRSIGRFGGTLFILRAVGEHYAGIHAPAEDFGPGTVAGKPAVFLKPVTPEGWGKSAIVIAEDFGVTVLEAHGITLAELVRIAEGLY